MQGKDEFAEWRFQDRSSKLLLSRSRLAPVSAVVVSILLVLGANSIATSADAQNVIAYPSKGQSADQQSHDRYECHLWAVQQSGFDPSQQTAQAAPPQQTGPQGGVLTGAARGAAVGAVGGAIGGDAGKGAAIGAGAGAVVGGIRRADHSHRPPRMTSSTAC